MNVLSFQSHVVYGHVGNGAACIALERLGHEVWPVPTVLLSNHAGYPAVAGETLPAEFLRRLVDGLDANGRLGACNAVLSGYLGHADQAAAVADAVRRVKRANPTALYLLDPVFGDAGRAYAKPGVAEAMARELLPLADIVTPNLFELASLASVPIRGPSDARVAAGRLGRPLVLATSVPIDDRHIGTIAVAAQECWLATTPRLEDAPQGSGDLMAALFLGRRLSGSTMRDALASTVAPVFHILRKSVAARSQEMLLIENQDAMVSPPELREMQIVKPA